MEFEYIGFLTAGCFSIRASSFPLLLYMAARGEAIH